MESYLKPVLKRAMHLDWSLSRVNNLIKNIYDILKQNEVFIHFNQISGELGERLTSAFWLISDTVERFNWYRFPLKMKKILPIIINVAQVPVVLDCFGSTACVRGSFKKV